MPLPNHTNATGAGFLSTGDVPLRIELLGDFRLFYEGEPVTRVHTERLQSLLAYLVLHAGTPQSRQHLAFSFWPDSREKQALGNLRNVLHRLRKALPEADRFLQADTQSLCWRADRSYTLDVADFERLLAQARDALQQADSATAQTALQDAISFYRGDLLTGHYDDWILPERERLYQACTRALEQLIHLLETSRDYATAIQYANRLHHLDPLREPTVRLLMRLHALNHDRASALRIYRQGVEILKQELDLEPEAATVALYRQITGKEDVAGTEPPPSAPQLHEIALVGRHPEWKKLRDAWHTAADGNAHLLTVNGEAGIGKTRLTEELLTWTGRQGIATARARCYAAEGHLAYAPVITWLRSEALRDNLSLLDTVWLTELMRVLPELHTEHPALPPPGPLRESWQRQRLFEALARAVLADGHPLLLVLDDLQWSDTDTLEWLRFLLRFAPNAPLLIAGTVRTEEVAPEHPLQDLLLDLGRDGQVTEIWLPPLSADETAHLAHQVAGAVLDETQASRLFRETEGNPLFVVESVRAGLPDAQADAPPLPGPAPPLQPLPAKVQAVITRRLSQLSARARSLVSLAAAMGRAFSVQVLAHASHLEEEPLIEAMDELWRARIIREYGVETYDFAHDKLREVAYAAISPVRRRLLHRRVAEAIETLHAADLDAVSAQLAAHYEGAGLREQAVAFYERAAAAAERVGSHNETAQLLNHALDLLAAMPENSQRKAKRLAILMSLGLALRLARGHAADAVGEVFESAMDLCKAVGEARQRFSIQRGLWSFHLLRGGYRTAHDLADALLALADRLEDDALRLEAYVSLGLTCLWQGELSRARAYLEQSLTLYDPQQHDAHVHRFGQDPGVAARSLLAYVQCLLGYPQQADTYLQEALAAARTLDHPFSRSYALQHAMLVAHSRRDNKTTRTHAEALLALSQERGFAYWLGPARIGLGWALAEQEQPARGLADLHQGLTEHHARGARLSTTLWMSMLADACRRAGRIDEALGHVHDALALADETGERIWEADLYRMKGDLLLSQGAPAAEGEACYEQALDVARRQRARLLELRAALHLGRLRHRQGRIDEARVLLHTACDWFTEGFDLPDFVAARTLLDTWA